MLLMLLLMQPQFCFCFWLLPLATFAECCQASLLCRIADWNYLARLAASQPARNNARQGDQEELGEGGGGAGQLL